MRKYFIEIIKQGAKLKPEELDWIDIEINEKTGKEKIKIITGYLARFLRNRLNYIFIRESAKEGVQRFIYRNGVYQLSNDYDFKAIIKKYIPESLMRMYHVNEVLQNLYSDENYITYSKINPEKYINFRDGLLNIDTWEIEPHNPKILSTIQLPINFPKNCNKPEYSIFDDYLNYLIDGNMELRQLLLQFMGVTLSNIYGHRMKKALFMVGPHNTGKSKIKELLIKLLGEQNANTLDLETLEARFGSSNIFNKRLIGSNDMSFMKVKELKIFKLLTGGDTMFMEMKGENGFNAKFNGIAWFCCNELPMFGGDKGDGVYNRIAIVKTNETPVPEPKQNKNLLEDMFNEKDYIVSLALKALKQVINNNYNYSIPDICNELLEKYKIDNDSFLTFFNTCTIERKNEEINDKCTKPKLYKAYSEWCKDNNNGYKLTKKEIQTYLVKLNKADIKIVNGYHYYSKFTLTLNAKIEYAEIYNVYSETHNEPDFFDK